MNKEFKFYMDKEAIAQTAQELRDAIEKELAEDIVDYPSDFALINQFKDELNPLLDMCIEKKIIQPFDLIGYSVSKFGGWTMDEIRRQEREIDPSYKQLTHLLAGGEFMDFLYSVYNREHLMPPGWEEYYQRYEYSRKYLSGE